MTEEREPATRYTDGEWHRLYPLTPLLRGGLVLLGIIGFIAVNLRDLILEFLFMDDQGRSDADSDPLVWLYENGLVWVAAGIILAVVLALMAGFYLSWRINTYRITAEVVEVRNGIIFRTHRKGRLDRIQGINIVRPFLARVLGAAKLEVTVAGHGANVKLDYLSSSVADALRREVLRLASGAQAVHPVPSGSDGPKDGARLARLIDQRVNELLGPERDPALAAEEAVVTMKLGRLIGSTVMSGFTVFAFGVLGAVIWGATRSGSGDLLIIVFPTVIALGGFYLQRFMRSLRYSVASTPDGLRIGFGLLTTSNETLPPGRIHAIALRQPLLWRAAGWWEVRINRASTSAALGAAGQSNTTILPVGNLAEALMVLDLAAPGLMEPTAESGDQARARLIAGLVGSGTAAGFTISPPRAWILRWFARRRNGLAVAPGFVLIRTGIIWRQLIVVPEARMQSVGFHQGPLERALRLGAVKLNTVSGPIAPRVGALDAQVARVLMAEVAAAAILSSSADRTHRWQRDAVSL